MRQTDLLTYIYDSTFYAICQCILPYIYGLERTGESVQYYLRNVNIIFQFVFFEYKNKYKILKNIDFLNISVIIYLQMYVDKLIEVGLSPHKAAIYDFLTTKGASSASLIARNTKIQRTLVYVVLGQLLEQGLITKDLAKKVARFQIANPEKLTMLIEQQSEQARLAKSALETIATQLAQAYSIQSGQPGVWFYEGIRGMKAVYNDINTSGVKEIWVIRSRIAPAEEMRALIAEQIEKQLALGIAVRVINSSHDENLTKYLDADTERKTERRIIAGEVFKNPAQVIIYASKTAFTTYNDPIMTTVIEHADVAETLRSIYKVVWHKTLAETQDLQKKLGV